MGKRQTQNKQVCLAFCISDGEFEPWAWGRACQAHRGRQWDTLIDKWQNQHRSASGPVLCVIPEDICLLQHSLWTNVYVSMTHPSCRSSLQSTELFSRCWRQNGSNATEFSRHRFSISDEVVIKTHPTQVTSLRELCYAVLVCDLDTFFALVHASVCTICKDSAVQLITVQTELFIVQYRTISNPISSQQSWLQTYVSIDSHANWIKSAGWQV